MEYPNSQAERNRWGDKIKPYSLRVGDQLFHVGRGVGGHALAYMILVERGNRIGKAIAADDADEVSNQIDKLWKDDLHSQFLPFIDSLKGGDDTFGKKKLDFKGGELKVLGNRVISDLYLPGNSLRRAIRKAKDGKLRVVDGEEYSQLDPWGRTFEARNGWDLWRLFGSPVTKVNFNNIHCLLYTSPSPRDS